MHIIHIASELAPLAKVGGLADVLLGLTRELSWKGHDVDIIIPKYDCMDSNEIRDLTVVYPDLMSFYEGKWFPNTVWMGWVENLRVYFIEPHHPRYFFNRGCFYGCEDDTERFLYFSRAALEFLFKKQIRPNIIHVHDWQMAIIPVLYHDMYEKIGYQDVKFVLTIHNMEYQGRCSKTDLERIGLKDPSYDTPDKMQDPIYPEALNLLKGGIVYADFVTTVSPTYAQEVKTEKGGMGLDKVLIKYEKKFKGILNGLDYSYWNPEIDRYLPVHYSSREMPANKKDRNTLDKKGYIKKLARERLLLAEAHKPFVGCVARLVPQKGIDLIKFAIQYVVDKGGQFILLGSSPIPSINAEFHELKRKYDDHADVSLILHYQEELAHLIYAAADMFIVPSIFEPCGLTQLISLKYGTIPIVRRTGGLSDTIFDIDFSGKPLGVANGYTFDNPDEASFSAAIDRAIKCWFEQPDRWHQLMISDMNIDYSWNKSSNEYLEIYNTLNAKSKPVKPSNSH